LRVSHGVDDQFFVGHADESGDIHARFLCAGERLAMRPPPLAIRASARFEQRVKDLWLSATGAVMNGGWRPRTKMRV
jgi:hypothetical protein